MGWLIERATSLIPSLADLPLVETWAGFRPGTPDHVPIVGPDPELAGLYYATGHFRSGILAAPLTAQMMADLLLDGVTAPALERFGVARLRLAG